MTEINELTDELTELQATTDKTPKFTLCGLKVLAKCTHVYDGDTIHAVFKFNNVMQRFTVRMQGYNSAEIKGVTEEERTAAQRAKKALCDLILNKIVNLEIGDFDKYGRLLGTVIVDGINVNAYMVAGGYGCNYDGSGEKLWH
ncbi:SNase-like [Pacmanvirus A23]|uniref:SNase-like n=1 Tax=Pacmanvirus A23 TaxID=1932881 RepID=UPI000A092411|nr:SNase-like [Pacmanvirus A23]SIP85838.1 SNase-like [Pacmanvirus A23]